ncbi:MAG TPA: ParA family protein [Candidatus Acidoferrum sp.]|jgi:chromosome partitioning protein|nr:ParA family protein [Candidatus Acidoferrum sp.]
MTAVVTLATAKGGVGKTTLSVAIGTTLALDGYRVTVLDCDVNQHASAFAKKANIAGFAVTSEVGEDTVLKALRQAVTDRADLVLLDLPGGTSRVELKAMQKSHFVLVPAQPSFMDIRDAMRTLGQVDDAEELCDHPIARAVIWTRVMPGFESASARSVRTSLEKLEAPVFRTALLNRALYQEMMMTGQAPQQMTSKAARDAADNLKAIADELIERLGQVALAESAA